MSVRIGPFGYLFDLPRVSPEINAPVQRASSGLTLLSGGVTAQKSPRASRSWVLACPHYTGAEANILLALESGVYGTDLFMYDPFTAGANMLHPGVAVPGLLGAWHECADEVTQESGVWMVNGGPVRSAAGFTDPLIVGRSVGGSPAPVPAVAGVTYTASAHVDDDATVMFRWVDVDGTQIDTDTGSTDDERPFVTAVAPTDTAGVVLEVDGDATAATAFQLNEGALITWIAGQGVPAIHLAGVEQSLSMATAAGQFRAQGITVVEVASLEGS